MTAAMRTRLISLEEPGLWTAALQDVPHSIAHEVAFRAALDSEREDARCFLFVAESSIGKAVCPILERPADDYVDIATPYGFGGFVGRGDLTGLDQAWRAFIETRGYIAGYIAQHPSLACNSVGAEEERFESSPVYLMDLRLEENDIIAGMSKRRRPSLRRWLKEVEVVTNRDELVEAFVKLYPPHMARLGAASVYFFGDRALRRMAALDSVALFGARNDAGEIEAVSMVAATPPCADYLFFAATEDARDHSVGLIWCGMREAKQRGAEWGNLGGAIREGDGVGEFKRRFGATLTPTTCLKQIYNPQIYSALCQKNLSDPQDRHGYFPAYRAQR